ncbi:MAG TPA: helix-turn-helix domain-containing protein [Pseudonocardiaceae bacterium]
MPRRSYDHYCPIARALDSLGERWTLLIIRELLAGPRRYSELLADLPGVSTDVLATRLREMERDGLVHRRKAARTAGHVYELTVDGQRLLPVLEALADWGGSRLAERRSTDALRGHWFAVPLLRLLRPLLGAGAGTVEVRLDEDAFHIRYPAEAASDGAGLLDPVPVTRPVFAWGEAEQPDVVVHTDTRTAADLAAGRLDLAEAVEAGRLTHSTNRPAPTLRV